MGQNGETVKGLYAGTQGSSNLFSSERKLNRLVDEYCKTPPGSLAAARALRRVSMYKMTGNLQMGYADAMRELHADRED